MPTPFLCPKWLSSYCGKPAASSRAAVMASASLAPPIFTKHFSKPAHEKVTAPPVAHKLQATNLKILTTFGELSVAEEVALTMGIPAAIVQMVTAFQMLQHGAPFQGARQLFEAAEDLLNNPEKQARVVRHLSEALQARNEDREDSSHDQPRRGERGESSQDQTRRGERGESSSGPKEGKGPGQREERRESSRPQLYTAKAQAGNVSVKRGQANEVEDLTGGGKPVDNKAQLKERVERLARENRWLRQRKLCCKCKAVDLAHSGVTFLPCGHFITCQACADAFDHCPACGKAIMGTVRTYLS